MSELHKPIKKNLFQKAGSVERAGAGKKTSGHNFKQLLIKFICKYKAGSPTDPNVYWISLAPRQLAMMFTGQYQIPVSNGVVKRLLKELGYRYRKPSKVLAAGIYPQRDEQIEVIFSLISLMCMRLSVISIDCKKKERLGILARDGKCLCTGAIKVSDHDYEHLSKGKVIPHGIYDLQANRGYLTVGTSSETAGFILDNLFWWWTGHGIHQYPDAESIVILCGSGEGNSYRHHIFKYMMTRFAKQTGISLIICHYPPYSSKWNPIGHRLFCHLHKAANGVVFDSYQTVMDTFSKAQTSTGLTVVIRLNLKYYQTGQK